MSVVLGYRQGAAGVRAFEWEGARPAC